MTRTFALLLTLLSCLPLRAANDKFEPARNLIRQQLVQNHVPSIAVAVAQHGHIVWEQGFGWANREERILADEHTMYSLASISKPFTATGLMTLVEAGKIDLDRPINDYLGDAKLNSRVGDAKDATVRRVANHTSGLPLHYHFFYPNEPWKKPSMDETILRYGNLIVAPGEKYEYSNLGFGVIDYVIERTSGIPFADYMRQAVFEPLGLTHTSVNVGPGLEKFQAQRYTEDGSPIPFL
jgi:CubicO group peptidase (beta-lactamase class C family)